VSDFCDTLRNVFKLTYFIFFATFAVKSSLGIVDIADIHLTYFVIQSVLVTVFGLQALTRNTFYSSHSGYSHKSRRFL